MGTLSPNPWDIYRGGLTKVHAKSKCLKVTFLLCPKGDISILLRQLRIWTCTVHRQKAAAFDCIFWLALQADSCDLLQED